MSTTKEHATPVATIREREVVKMGDKKENAKNYKGFVAGVFSGIAKLSGKKFMTLIFRSLWTLSSSSKPIETPPFINCSNTLYQYLLTPPSRPPLRHHQSPTPNLRPLTLLRPPPMPPPNRAERRRLRPLQRCHPTPCRLDVHGQHHARLLDVLPTNPPPVTVQPQSHARFSFCPHPSRSPFT